MCAALHEISTLTHCSLSICYWQFSVPASRSSDQGREPMANCCPNGVPGVQCTPVQPSVVPQSPVPSRRAIPLVPYIDSS